MLKQIDQLERGITKGALAAQVYSGATYDVAIPQQWLDKAVEQLGVEYSLFLSGVVWLYPTGCPVGILAPLTIDHLYWLFQLSQ